MIAQKRKSALLPASLLILLALFFSVYSKHNRSVMHIGNYLLSSLVYPIEIVYSGIAKGTNNLWQEYVSLRKLRPENERLKKSLANLKKSRVELIETRKENRKLQSLLKIKENTKIKSQAAKVIAYDPSNWSELITINKGSQDGLQISQAVISEQGLVGQIINVGLVSSQVLLISDRRSSVDVFSQRSRVRGLVDGSSNFKARWEFVFAEQDVKAGDLLLSSGLDGIFPEGILVAKVNTVSSAEAGSLFQVIKVNPVVDFSKLEHVLILDKQ